MEVSKAEDFGPAEKLVTLPVPGPGGKVLVVKVAAAPLDELFPLLDGIPGLGADKRETEEADLALREGRFAAALPMFKKYAEMARPLVERFVMEPRISFEDQPGDGAVPWRSLHWRNQVALVGAISEFSQSGSVESELATFPALERGGRANGRGPGVGGELAAAAAHADSEAPESAG